MIHNAFRFKQLAMKKVFIIIEILLIYLFLTAVGFSKESNYLKKGIELFQKKDFIKSKIEFEKDLVFNPKSEKSYLYLAKIFNKDENDEEQEINLNSVLILNPQNDEAIYMLLLLKIKQSDYDYAKELFDNFNLVCVSFCNKKAEIQKKFEKLNPKDAKINN